MVDINLKGRIIKGSLDSSEKTVGELEKPFTEAKEAGFAHFASEKEQIESLDQVIDQQASLNKRIYPKDVRPE